MEDMRELADVLVTKMCLLNVALDDANEALGKKFEVVRVEELEPVYAYSRSLEHRIQQLKLMDEIDDAGQSFEQWRNRYEEFQIPDEMNKRHWWQ